MYILIDWKNGFINEFGIKIVLKSFEERVLIFTTSIENLYIFKVTKHKEDCRNNQSLKFTFEDMNEIQRNRYRIHQNGYSQNYKENVIKVDNK